MARTCPPLHKFSKQYNDWTLFVQFFEEKKNCPLPVLSIKYKIHIFTGWPPISSISHNIN